LNLYASYFAGLITTRNIYIKIAPIPKKQDKEYNYNILPPPLKKKTPIWGCLFRLNTICEMRYEKAGSECGVEMLLKKTSIPSLLESASN
jgi:hypothetical protein